MPFFDDFPTFTPTNNYVDILSGMIRQHGWRDSDFDYAQNANYYVTSFRNESILRHHQGQLKTACISSSGVDTRLIQSPTTNYLVTPNINSASFAAHALQTYLVSKTKTNPRLMEKFFDPVMYIKDKDQIKSAFTQPLSMQDRTLLTYAQFLGTRDLLGHARGGEYWHARQNPGRYTAIGNDRKWSQALEFLRTRFPGASRNTLLALGQRCCLSMGATEASGSDGSNRVLGMNAAGASIRGTSQVRNFTTPAPIAPARDVTDAINILDSNFTPSVAVDSRNIYGNQVFTSNGLSPIGGSTSTTTGRTTAASAAAQSVNRAAGTPPSSAGPTPPPRYQGVPSELNLDSSIDSLFQGSEWETRRDEFSDLTVPVDNFVEGLSYESIQTISNDESKRLEKKYASGGLEHENDSVVQANAASQQALNTLREKMTAFGDMNDADSSFMNRLGRIGLPDSAFSIMEVSDYRNLSSHDTRLLKLGGALIQKRDGKDVWLVDNPGKTSMLVSGMLSNGRTSDAIQPAFNLADVPVPAMNMNLENMRFLNTSIHPREAVGKGMIIPIKENTAIFVPSFANVELAMGIEAETNSNRLASDIVNYVLQNHGYDLTKMGFQGNFDIHHDPSIYGSGYEYISPTMSGIRGYKAAYLMGDAFRGLNMDVSQHPLSNGRNDPSGIHINMGTIPTSLRTDAFKFAVDYMRLLEDVYKKISTNDTRYRYHSQGSHSFTSVAARHGLSISHDMRESDYARQFWSQDISNIKKAGSSGMTEYAYWRTHGKHFGEISLNPYSDEGRRAKYRTLGLHKLLLTGVIENRAPIMKPGGEHLLNQTILTSKMAGDIYAGAVMGGAFAETDKLIPPKSGWDESSKNTFYTVMDEILGITDPLNKRFMWDMYNNCKG